MAGKSKGRSRRQHHVQPAFGAKRQWGFQSRSLEPSQDTPHLTMQQQARNTERHSISRSTLQLRHHQVSFVSAGNMLRDDLDDSNLETVNQSLKELNTTSRVASVQEGVVEDQTSPDHYLNEMKMPEAPSQQSQAPDHEQQDGQNEMFFIDLIGDKSAHNAGQPKPETRPRSPTPADSSEDEVVFVGRNKSKLRQSPVDKWACPETPPVQYMTGTKENTQGIQCQNSEIPEVNEAKTSPEIAHSKLADARDMGVGDDSEISIDFGGGSRRRRRRGRRARQRRRERNDEELILADYIANMQNEESSEDQSSDPSLPAQTVPKTDGLDGKNSTMPQKKMVEEHVQNHVQHSLSGRSNEFDDLDDLSTSDEIPDEIGHIFSKRRRGVEVQYLVTGKDQVPDDARWILKEHLIMTGAGEQIEEFDSNGNLRSGFIDDGSGSPSTDFEFNDHLSEAGVEGEDILSGEDQEGLSDEQLARLLERQEKFGLGADDWKWAQDSGASDSEQCLDTIFQQKRPSRKSKRNKKPHFPPAGAFADALDQDPYHGFDVMDFERPSLRKKPKRGQQALDYALSDSELEWELYQAWENDRTKKKAKKREREELRAQGLLGKQGKMGTGERYSDPITTDDLKNKIKAFLVSPSESLSLPPMDKKDRKLVHDLADAVSLKSQSRGGGASRFPMLYKTARTPSFDNVSIVDVDKIFSSGRFTRRTGGRKGFGGNARKPVKPQRSGASAAASYMEGDVVGASAPEIGVENRGRAMLEKMGWSTGTALGATDNKGILKPLAQVVKNTKAGLG